MDIENRKQYKNVGKNVTIHDQVAVINPGNIYLSNDIRISEFVYLAGGQGVFIGNYVHLATHVVINGGGYCIIEDYVGVAANSIIITGTDDVFGDGILSPMVNKKYRAPTIRSYVHLKKHSFIATNVIIHPGITVGEGAVVGSGSVVTKDLDPWSVYIGSPVRKIKERKKDSVILAEQKILKEDPSKKSDFSNIINQICKYEM
jgi:acetyltransferase-like isoleucine patch superfamily enzyme